MAIKNKMCNMSKDLFRYKVFLATVAFGLFTCLSSPAIDLFSDETPVNDISDKLRAAAKAGDSAAQLKLADEYFYGKNRTQNYDVAVHWFRKAALQNNSEAQFNLAVCYEYGLGLKPSKYQAFVWYRKAADSGLKQARFNLALCYAKGIPPDNNSEDRTPGVFADFAQAEKIMLKLSAEGYAPAMRELAILYLEKPKNEKPQHKEIE
ncbi:MAG: tetratricopeptide repeat protein, partial [Victivallaceae bacterium]